MKEKLKRKTLNDAFKRFQRLPFVPSKNDIRASAVEKPAWYAMPFGPMAPCAPTNPNSTFQALAE
jgi:hypothetical protein